jgi:uracil-DNA glycosylase
VRAMLNVVRPRVLIFAGSACEHALDPRRGFLSDQRDYEEAVPIANGKATIPLFRSFRATVRHSGEGVRVVALAHPSRYAKRHGPWQQTLALLEAAVHEERPR